MLVLAAWLGVSIPLAVVTGRAIGGTATVRTYPPTSGPSDEVLRRLPHIELELEEVPPVQLSLEGWADDPHLCTELRALRAEAERLRRVLDATTDRRPPDADVSIVA